MIATADNGSVRFAIYECRAPHSSGGVAYPPAVRLRARWYYGYFALRTQVADGSRQPR
jgi:hypothetical protein